MKIQIVGDGIKECALARNLEKYGSHEVIVTPGNEGTKQLIRDLDMDLPEGIQLDDVLQSAELFAPDRVIFMDERVALSNLKNLLEERGFEVFGPDSNAARLLYDKAEWTNFFNEHGLVCPKTESFLDLDSALKRIEQTDGPIVIKERGRQGRFSVPYSMDEAQDTLRNWFDSESDHKADEVLISPYYSGIRFNVPVMVYKNQVMPFDSMVTQRGVYENEDDAQTKAMGAFSPALDVIPSEIYNEAIMNYMIPFFVSMDEENIPYEGFADGEFIYNEDGLRLVNMKCGLADCGLCSILLRSKDDVAHIIDRLKNREIINLHFAKQSACTIMLAAKNYPEGFASGEPILVDEDVEGDIFPYHAILQDGQLVSHGGRVLAVAALGKDLSEASLNAQEAARHIHCDDLIYRSDIGDPEFFKRIQKDRNPL